MRSHWLSVVLVSAVLLGGAGWSSGKIDRIEDGKTTLDPSATRAKPAQDLEGAPPLIPTAQDGRPPLYFIENQGQVDRRVKLYARTGGQAIWFTGEGVCFSLAGVSGPDAPGTGEAGNAKIDVVRLTPLGMSQSFELIPMDPQEGRVNYFRGADPREWHTDIPTYRAVLYREAYPGVDLKFYGAARRLEYDIIVKAGADPNQVRFHYAGIRRLEVTGEGDLSVTLPGGGQLLQKKPLVYQEVGGRRVIREAKFRVQGEEAQQVFSFEVAAYDPRRPLIIDPLVLIYSTFLGGGASESSFAVAADAGGFVYVTGDTYSTDFPAQNPYQGTLKGSTDVFVTKLSADGKSLVYSTYMGGSGRDLSKAIAVDGSGCAYITGQTESGDFPTQNAGQPKYGGGYSDVFVAGLSQGGNSLVYSTYLGGNHGYDTGYGIAVDGNGSAYVAGVTESGNFPIKNAYQESLPGAGGAFLTKFTPGGSLDYSTFLSGSSGAVAHGVAVDHYGCAHVTGSTSSNDFPTKNAYQDSYSGGVDAFLTKFSPDGQSLVYSTYLGGSLTEDGHSVALDGSGATYVSGWTTSLDFPTLHAFQPEIGSPGYWDIYVAKFSLDGRSLVYSTYLGGDNHEYVDGSGLAVDGAGFAHVTGYTWSRNFPTKSPYQALFQGNVDAFVTRLSKEGDRLIYSTYLGCNDQTYGQGIAVDGSGAAYVTGHTDCPDFPARDPYQGALKGAFDAFVAKLSLQGGGAVPMDLLLLD